MSDGDMMEAIAENTTRFGHPPCDTHGAGYTSELLQVRSDLATLFG